MEEKELKELDNKKLPQIFNYFNEAKNKKSYLKKYFLYLLDNSNLIKFLKFKL